jgi:hypothetical protein
MTNDGVFDSDSDSDADADADADADYYIKLN